MSHLTLRKLLGWRDKLLMYCDLIICLIRTVIKINSYAKDMKFFSGENRIGLKRRCKKRDRF